MYQLSAEPNDWNADDKQNFSRYFPKRLNAEVLLDAIDQVTAAPSNFGGLPAGTRAVELPDNGFDSYFLTVFGRPEATSACECERSGEANLAQCLHLLNSSAIQGKLTAGRRPRGPVGRGRGSRPRRRRSANCTCWPCPANRPPRRPPSPSPTWNVKPPIPRVAYEDIVWALLNTKEFLFNH